MSLNEEFEMLDKEFNQDRQPCALWQRSNDEDGWLVVIEGSANMCRAKMLQIVQTDRDAGIPGADLQLLPKGNRPWDKNESPVDCEEEMQQIARYEELKRILGK